MTGFLTYIFWFFIILYLIKFLARIFAPILLRYFANKIQNRFHQQFSQNFYNQQHTSKKEGEVTIEKNKDSEKKKASDVGEYVDFEEIED